MLAAETHGAGADVTFLHGFTQTRSSWLPVINRLQGVRATLIDAPGHGGSPAGPRSLPQTADDIHACSPNGTFVGYSMGARMALHVALAHPGHVERLVLVSGTPGIEDDNERLARVESDNALADRIESIGVPDFIDEWLSGPMFAGLDPDSSMRDERLRNSAEGLAGSLRTAGTGTQDNLWPRLQELRMPVLIVCGALDAKFTGIARRMNLAIPGSSLHVVEGAGHTVHLESTAAFVSILQEWLVTTAR